MDVILEKQELRLIEEAIVYIKRYQVLKNKCETMEGWESGLFQ